MIGLNKVILIGQVGKDASFKNSGATKCANFTLGTHSSWLDAQGNKKQATEWHKVACFGNLSDIFQKYVKEGQYIYLEGALKSNTWKDKNGSTHKDIYINANNIIMLGGKDDHQKAIEAQKQAYINKSLESEPDFLLTPPFLEKKTYVDKHLGEMEIEDIPF